MLQCFIHIEFIYSVLQKLTQKYSALISTNHFIFLWPRRSHRAAARVPNKHLINLLNRISEAGSTESIHPLSRLISSKGVFNVAD